MARQKGPFDAVQFTRESAERIASVVRTAETTPPAASPLKFEPFLDNVNRTKQVRQAKFSGSWPVGFSKVVTFPNPPTATASVINLSWPIESTYLNEDCIVGREGTNWWLVVPVLEQRTAVMVTQTATASFVTQTQMSDVITGVGTSRSTLSFLSDVSVAASLNTANCSITVNVTKSSATASLVTISSVDKTSVVTIQSTETGIKIVQHFTSSILRLRVP